MLAPLVKLNSSPLLMPMFKYAFGVFLLFSSFQVRSQENENPLKTKLYHALVKTLIAHTIPEVRPDSIQGREVIFLDSRAKSEFDVSRIAGARYVGYEDFDISKVADLPKHKEIVVYCSVSYRSEKIAEKLKEAGYTHVKNLYGGIFEWHNTGHEVVDSLGHATNKVHGYGNLWGKWLLKAEVVYDSE